MDLNELLSLASSIDTAEVEVKTIDKKTGVPTTRRGVPEQQDAKAKTYLGMIIDKGNKVLFNNQQTDKYMADIEEYIQQLAKRGIQLIPTEEPKQNEPQQDQLEQEIGTDEKEATEEPKEKSPLIP